MPNGVFIDLYCRLYVKSDDDEKKLRERISRIFGGRISGRSISDEFIDFRVTKNDAFLPDSMDQHGGFVYFPYTAEVHPKKEFFEDTELNGSEIYIDLLVHVIIELRKSGAQVVASCEYEDLIAKRTGWNWSEETPGHPPIAE